MAKQKGPSKKSRRRRRARRGSAPVVLVLLCLLIGAVALVTAMTIFFKIDAITLSGTTRYTQEEVARASGLKPGDNLILFDKFAAINRIFAQCPYLDEIQMRRRLPDQVEIIVTECVPVAVLQSGGSRWLMDRRGKLLEQVSSAQGKNLPVVIGAMADNPETGKYVEFLQQDLKKPLLLLLNTVEDDDILKDIDEIDLSQSYDIQFRYLGRFTVRLGSVEELDKKLRYLHTITEDGYLSANATGTLDLSDTQQARFIPETN